MTRSGLALLLLLAGVAGAVGGAVVGLMQVDAGRWPSYAGLFDASAPSVVSVSIDHPEPRVGSGFAVSTTEVITALHLVADAEQVTVRDMHGRAWPAVVLGSDARLDVALLRVGKEAALRPVAFGSSASLRVGDPVVAIGNPFGLGHSLSAGVVGHRGRRLSAEAVEGPRVDFIQLSIPLNPGNSGGPVFDQQGLVVGVLSGTHAQGQAIAFAVPVEAVRDGLEPLRRGEHLSRAFLGARFDDVDQGVQVTFVIPHSPADRAGLRVGDRLTAFGMTAVATRADAQRELDGLAGGQSVAIRLLRDGRVALVDVFLADWAEQPVVAAGMTLRAEPGVGGEVLAVRPRSRAEAAGVRVGDLVRAVDGVPVRAPADVKDALQGRDGAQVELVRGGAPVTVQLFDIHPL